MSARWVVGLISLMFAGVLAAIVGWRLTSEAMAVLVGVAAGVLASIPTSLLMVWVTLRQVRLESERQAERQAITVPAPREERELARPAAPATPPVIVLQPQAGQANGYGWGQGFAPPLAQPAARRFSVIGGSDGWEQGPSEARWSGARTVEIEMEDVWQS